MLTTGLYCVCHSFFSRDAAMSEIDVVFGRRDVLWHSLGISPDDRLYCRHKTNALRYQMKTHPHQFGLSDLSRYPFLVCYQVAL